MIVELQMLSMFLNVMNIFILHHFLLFSLSSKFYAQITNGKIMQIYILHSIWIRTERESGRKSNRLNTHTLLGLVAMLTRMFFRWTNISLFLHIKQLETSSKSLHMFIALLNILQTTQPLKRVYSWNMLLSRNTHTS